MAQLLPEWHTQWGVMIAWPHAQTDWATILDDAEACYIRLARAILAHENLLVLCASDALSNRVRALLSEAPQERLHTRVIPYNDTWCRDYGPIAVLQNEALCLLDFQFNAWGNKFAHEHDNKVNKRMVWRCEIRTVPLVLEGGAIDTDGQGTVLTTSHCLLNDNRNPQLTRAGIETELRVHLGAQNILWLNHGHLEGDDTDAHIDTLARFCNPSTLAWTQCLDPSDSHYEALTRMGHELQALGATQGWDLIALPLPPAIYHREDGHRLPATYANFLIINDAVLVPVYAQHTDDLALECLRHAFPDRSIIPIDCRALIHQHGSLHCVTMQLPEGVL